MSKPTAREALEQARVDQTQVHESSAHDLILRPPSIERHVEKPPADPYSPEVIAAMKDNGDQPKSAEMEIVPGLTITLGVRAVYASFGGLVVSWHVSHHAPADFER